MGNRNTTENSSNNCYISQLPNEVLVHIFSYLGPADFGRCAQVCKHWQPLIYDESYWRYRLLTCYLVWNFKHLSEELPNDINRGQVQEIFDPYNSCSSRLIWWMRQRSFCPMPANTHRPIRLLFFGLGIAANRISRAIITGKNSSFEAVSLIQGNSQGVGGGVVIKYKARHEIHVITMYTNIKAVRENPGDPIRKDLFSKWMTNADGDKPPSLLPSIKELIRSVDCFVYSSNNDFMQKDNTWLTNAADCLNMVIDEAALNENSQCRRPVLHLSCSTGASTRTDDSLDQAHFVDRHQMERFPRPWNVCKVDLEILNEIEHGFNWLTYITLLQQKQFMTNY